MRNVEDATRTERLIELTETYGAHNYLPLPVVLDRGEASYVWDVDGRRYLDFLSCYSALSHGHRHPRLVAALCEQAQRLTLTSRAFHNDQLGPFLEELCEYSGTEMALPMNTGAEAVETALKAARKWACQTKGVPENEAEIIACRDNFHGRTITIISFSSEELYRRDFGPFTPGFTLVPYGDAAALEAAITPRTAAIHRRADPGRGRRHRAAEGLPAVCPRDHRAQRRPADRRRGADRARPHRYAGSASITKTSPPTSSSSARRSAAACTR